MDIIQTFSDKYFKEKSRILGNCYIIKQQNKTFYYECIVQKNQAKILTNTNQFLEEIAEFHHKNHPYIQKYYAENQSFLIHFDEIHTFKLPISILQVSKLFLNQSYLSNLKKYLDPQEIYIPVQIIDDEYVILDKHHELYCAFEYGEKMVNVYLEDVNKDILNPLYIAKEQNTRTIQDVKILPDKEYKEVSEQFNILLNSI